MDIYYLNNKIVSEKVQNFSVSSRYSDIRIGNRTVRENIKDTFGTKDLIFVDNLEELHKEVVPSEILILSSSVYAKNLAELEKFVKFASYSMINTLWGHSECFIYRGNKDRLINFLTEQRKRDIYFVNFPKPILDLTSFPELKALLSNNHDSRHFNDIKNEGNIYVKKSLNYTKLKTEYEFLAHVPEQLKNYYVEVFEYQQDEDSSKYSMVSYDYKDVAHQYLSHSISLDSFKKLMSILYRFFQDSKKVESLDYKKNSFENILSKNEERLGQLMDVNYYEELNTFLQKFVGISVEDHYNRIKIELEKRKDIYYKQEYIFSHGDLCYSNILFSEQEMEIKLIDPKGFENYGMRSPYYDMAKLSHSIYGNYDLIINSMSEIVFDKDMKASLRFTDFKHSEAFVEQFEELVAKMKMDLNLIRLIESSLFLSMIPFHYENKRKAFMLCVRSVELFENFISRNSPNKKSQ